MQEKILDLNIKDAYKFSLSVITDDEWKDMAHSIILEKGEILKNLKLLGFKVVIKDNKAKFKICFEDSSYHENEYHIDEFGRISKDYKDCVSYLIQDVMAQHYGKDYLLALSAKLDAKTNPVD